jgi:hypothetical protein
LRYRNGADFAAFEKYATHFSNADDIGTAPK